MKNVPLGDIATLVRGVSFSKEEGSLLPLEGHLPVIRAGSIQASLLLREGQIWVPSDKIKSTQKIRIDDIVMCTSSGSSDLVGKCARSTEDFDGSFGAFCVGIRADQEKASPSYLYHFLCSPVFKNWTSASSGANIKNIRVSELAEFQVPLPPLPEQKHIAAILDKADAIRRKRQQAIQLADDFLRAVFLDMFGDPVTNPKGWPSVKLGEVCGVGSSKRVFVDEFTDTGVPFYRGTEVGALGEGQKIQAELFISQEHYDDLVSHSGAPEVGDLLLPSICHDGRIWKVNHKEQFYFKDGRVLWIKLNRELIDSDYLRSYLQRMFLSNYSAIASGTTFAELKIVNLKAMNILSPPLALQRKFSELVKAISETGKLYANADLEGEDLFSSLAKQAFSGQL
ncbi:restriction endonuclease subunit S [Pseudomonas aeruginosa]|uniref:restriction endonuclease subunit S n=1 Tax=Pseudomonas aeruginosa TaxID=287 RepID=UPI0032E42B99